MFVSDPFFQLPTELCCVILRDWLYLSSVFRLDSALCNAEEKRSLLWNTIFASSQCVLSPGLSYYFHEREMFEWLCSRKVRVSGLYFDGDVDDSIRDYFRCFGASIRKLEFYDSGIAEYMRLISSHCSKIVCISFSEMNYLFLPSDISRLSCNLKALDLGRTRMTDNILKQIVKQCPNITHLSIVACSYLTDDCGRIIGRNLKYLQYLNISCNDYLSDTMLMKIAKHNYRTLEVLHMEDTENMFGFDLMTLLKKCTKMRSVFITYHEGDIHYFDFSLFGNLTELSICHRKDETGEYLLSIVKYFTRLQRLRLDFDIRCAQKTSRFHLKELTRERIPELKALAPFGVPNDELEVFCLMRPEVEIIDSQRKFASALFDMKW